MLGGLDFKKKKKSFLTVETVWAGGAQQFQPFQHEIVELNMTKYS